MSEAPVVNNAVAVAPEAPSMNMTGEEAKAFVEAQKKQQGAQAKAPATPRAEAKPTTESMVKDAAKQAQETLRKFRVKVDNEELEVDEDELKRGYSHQKAANKIYQQGITARKQAEEFLGMMKDPQRFYDVAKKLGHDPRKLAETYLASQLEDELTDPRERKIKELEYRLQEKDKLEQTQKEKEEQTIRESLKKKFTQEYETQFVSALEENGLPANKAMVAEMAKYIARATKIHYKMSAQEAAKLVKEDIIESQKRLLSPLDGEKLMKLLGEDIASKIRSHDLSKLDVALTTPRAPSEQDPKMYQKQHRSSKTRMSREEWRKFNRG